jgi:hypothetical protein
MKLCAGACPLYWENAGSFSEIENVRNIKPGLRNFIWSMENRIRLRTRELTG